MDIRELNKKYFEIYAELDEARAILPQKQFDVMYHALLDFYKKELDVSVGEWKLENTTDLFKLRFDLTNKLPRRFLFWHNTIGKLLLKKYKQEFKQMLETVFPKTIPETNSVSPVNTENDNQTEN